MTDHEKTSAQEFDGLHVVVTGGCGALGGAVVQRLLDRGAWCHIPAMNTAEAGRSAHKGHERVRLVPGVDLANENQVESFYRGVPSLWASVHVAGGFAMQPIEKATLADLRAMLDTNLATCFLCCCEAVRRMRAGKGDGGRIVNVAAKPALVPTGGMAAYAASKAAVANLTVSLAEELKDSGVWVNAVVPSIMDTPANRKAMPDADHGAWPRVEDVAASIVFLASPGNRVSRGALVPVYGRS